MKKTNSVMLSCLVALIWLAMGNPVHAASPVIKDFSSGGGHVGNKNNAKDTMYLVKPGDKVTFKVKAEGAQGYEWLVNKAVQKVKGDTFTWTAPNEKSIWEIHLTASNKEGEAHQEWVVSTLTKSEAPVIFDYFCPDRSLKDPWGRPLPKWDYRKDMPDKKIENPDFTAHAYARGVGSLTIPSKVAHGTWIFQRRYRPGKSPTKKGYFGWRIFHDDYYSRHYYYKLSKRPGSESWDHRVPSKYGPLFVHCMGRSVMGECCSHMGDVTDDWDEVRIVRTEDGWFYIWIGDEFWLDSLANENTLKEITSLVVYGPRIDGVQVYDRPVWPAKSIRLDEYRDDTTWRKKTSVMKKGIVIDGHGVTLADIAEAIDDPKIFRYDPATGTAVCYTDLVVKAGAELIINGETLKMHCNKDGEHQIRVGNGSTIRLNRATITSANKFYYLWAFTSACKNEQYKQWSGYPARSFSGRFLATDSTISNCGNFFPDTPGELVLKRCKFVNMVEVDIGNYWDTGYWLAAEKRKSAKGKKGLWFYNRKGLVDFRIEDCTIGGKEKPLDITFIGGDDLHKVTISNSRLDNIAARKGYRFRDWRRLSIPETEYRSCTIRLVNCKFKELKAQSSKAWIIPKYYLDVIVVDKEGNPLPDCKVRLINEADDMRYPAENLMEKNDWAYRHVSLSGKIKFWLDVNNLRAAVLTGEGGRTAPPNNKADTLVLTDFVQGEDERRDFTYTVQVTAPDGRFGERKGINPGSDWYREDPNKPVHTVKVVVDKPGRPAQPVRKPPPVVKTKSPWPTFRGLDHAHTGRSLHVGPSKCRPLWRYKAAGEIFCSPVIGKEGVIYVCSLTPDSSLHAVNPDGSRKWRHKVTTPPSNKYSNTCSDPAVGLDGTIFMGKRYSGRPKTLVAFSPEGKFKWEYKHPHGRQSCVPIPGPDGTVYFASGSGRGGKVRGYWMHAVSSDGKLKWTGEMKRDGSSDGYYSMPSPAFAPDGTIYAGTGSLYASVGAVYALNPDGTTKWTYKAKGRVLSSPAVSISEKIVYVGSREGTIGYGNNPNGYLLALGFDGSLKWKYKVGGEVTSSPAIGKAGEVYFGSRDGYFYALSKDGKEKWKYKTGDIVHSSPAIDPEGKIFFGSLDHYVYCLNSEGKLVWKYLTGGSVVSSPAIGADGTVYVGSADGYLYAFGK